MTSDRRRTVEERRRCDRVPAVFAVKKAVAVTGEPAAGLAGPKTRHVQLCQAEDIAPAGMTIKRPRGSAVQPRTELALSFSLPGSHEEISARGLVVTDANVGSFRRTGVRFIALRPEHAQLIAGYCRRQR
ncbi:MAG: PilZ domain-containing protein [Polyangia bacterium]|jgi:PilZ domain